MHKVIKTGLSLEVGKTGGTFYALVGHLMKIGGSSYNVYKRLFDSMVAPILDYGAPVWSRFCSLREIEKVQNQVHGFVPSLSLIFIERRVQEVNQALSRLLKLHSTSDPEPSRQKILFQVFFRVTLTILFTLKEDNYVICGVLTLAASSKL